MPTVTPSCPTSLASSLTEAILPSTVSNMLDSVDQCTCSASFPTSEALDAHLAEIRVSSLQFAGKILTSYSLRKVTTLFSSRSAEATQEPMATAMMIVSTMILVTLPPRVKPVLTMSVNGQNRFRLGRDFEGTFNNVNSRLFVNIWTA